MARDTLDVTDLVRANQSFSLDQYLGLWAIEETAFSLQWDMLQRMDLAAHGKGGEARTKADVSPMDGGSLVRIDISGTMTKKGSSMSDAGSTARIRREVRAAKNDPNVAGVLLVLDTPGGTVSGTSDLGNDIAALSAVKPTVTFAEDLMASAGLWVGLQSRKVFANAGNAIVGSMGVFIGLYDLTGMAAQKGVRPVVIKTGELKGAGFPGADITDAQKAMWQNLADQSFKEFKAAVMRGRPKMTADQLTELSRAGVYPAEQAIGLGLIDGICSIDDAIAELRAMTPSKRKASAKMSDEKPQAATLGQLESVCDGASSDFLLGMLKREASVETAQREWSRQQNATILELRGKVDALTAELATAAQSAVTVKAAQDAEVATLKTELAEATAKANAKTQFRALPEGKSHTGDSGEGSATSQWNAAIKAKTDGGMSKANAVRSLIDSQPGLYQAYLDEANGKGKVA